MKKVIEFTVLQILRQTGFETVSRRSLELIVEVFKDRLVAFLNTVSSRAALSMRSGISLVDLMDYIEDPRSFSHIGNRGKQRGMETSALKNARSRLFDVIPAPQVQFEKENLEEPKEWISPLSTRVEKFIHIYDFMPNFPPIHTFRLTLPKQVVQKNYSSRVKKRLEQSLKSEGNMIKLIKSSGSLPGYINYLYKNKE
ncbi:hypothetical protein PAEPH01_1753 [Pancytospora epiphaga]|nr:hypothetical protein PAEPH01_1753 [Pancytospora epiphaga]